VGKIYRLVKLNGFDIVRAVNCENVLSFGVITPCNPLKIKSTDVSQEFIASIFRFEE
jgi:hypothetical protein